jgi:SAM-dependent methyltransferase
LTISTYCTCITAFDPAEHLVEIGQITSNYLNFESTEKFDVILSFANHSTYDGNTEYTIKSYLEKIRNFLEPGGLLLFESHAPLYEGEGLLKVCNLISEKFVIKSNKIIKTGSFLDKDRTFLVCE